MPTASCLRPPLRSGRSAAAGLRFPPPAGLAIGSWRRRLAGVGVAAASASPFDELYARGRPIHGPSKKSTLWNLIQDIEPLDLSVIQKDVPLETVDAMKRTISGMLSFERNLELSEEDAECEKRDTTEDNLHDINLGRPVTIFRLSEDDMPQDSGKSDEESSGESMGEMLSNLTPQVEEQIIRLQSRLDAMKKELHDLKRKNSALQMQQFVGEEKNDLLDYLRSLTPEKVAELSESTCPGVQEAIQSVVHGLLATLSPKVHSKSPPPLENAGGALNRGGEDDDCAELVENTSLPFQPLISVPRDYLARLLFWCMLLGHYIRGLEYRLELAHLLRISSDVGSFPIDDNHFI
ncbi:unnamed protein product [Triticum turgidum subsp. durum]|uniref:Uncharacterized protein n=1 Tax=Triticum turgidum subsp. durum TaxID=4567 RepID=A0A9R0SHM5_TRITD|nr:unnamed protein product [Triticum turgidum subsp. durum]